MRSRIARRAVVALMVLGGPVLAAGMFRLGRAHDHERTLTLLGHHLQTRALAVRTDLASSEAAVEACRAFLVATPDVTPTQFETFTRALMGLRPGLAALAWAPRITAAGRKAHERRVRQRGLPDYRIVETTVGGVTVPAGDRPAYFPVLYTQPYGHNTVALGFDLGSEAIRRAALDRAMATGLTSLSDPVTLVPGQGNTIGVFFVAPVYSGEGRQAGSGRAPPLGFVCGVIRTSALGRSSYAHRAGPPSLTAIELVDDGPGGMSRVLSASNHAAAAPAGPLLSASVEANGKRWRLQARPTEAALAARRTPLPVELALTSFLGWQGLLGLALLLMKGSEEKEARRENHLINSVINSLADGIVVADRNGTFLFANRVARSILGDDTRDVPPNAWSGAFGLYGPDTETLFPAERLPLKRAIRGESVSDVEVFVRNARFADGIWVSVRGSPLRNKTGEIVGGVAVFRDVSAQKTSHALLQRLSSAVQQTADAVIITDRAGVIEYVNPAFETMTGYSRDEVVGRSPRVLRSGKQDDGYYRKLWETILAGRPFHGSPINIKKDGTLFHAEQTISPITSGNGEITHFVSVFRDMTERLRNEQHAIEMSLAAAIQRNLFPATAPRLPGYEIAGTVAPALATCGDYYDFIPLKDGSFGLVVADVCGHGVGPALIMAHLRAHLRALSRTHTDLTVILKEISTALHSDLENNLFVTMSLVSLSPNGAGLRWVNAGHPAGFIVDGRGGVKKSIESTGLPLGLLPDRGYSLGQFSGLAEGDLVLLVTDGVLEAESPAGVAFGTERVLGIVRESLDRPADEIVARLRDGVHAFVGDGGLVDDLTVVACRRVREN